ncbi:hypothetical protein Trydic_g6788 [Trypoxylus dichotomus]
MLLINFIPQGTTINLVTYYETLRKLHQAIKKKGRGMLLAVVVLLDNNTVAQASDLITPSSREEFDHLPDSPDLAFSGYLHF